MLEELAEIPNKQRENKLSGKEAAPEENPQAEQVCESYLIFRNEFLFAFVWGIYNVRGLLMSDKQCLLA